MSSAAAPAKMGPLRKRIQIEPDQSTWKTYSYPFKKQDLNPSVDVASALLLVGRSAIVKTVPQWRTAITWAQLKYSVAIGSGAQLCLHRYMKDLDKHHKSVLSEDFGVGVALEWLTSVFDYEALAHGAVTVGELGRLGLLKNPPAWKKVGDNKCPDFIAVDSSGRLQIIECKGSVKSGRSAIPFERAREQKRAIKFPLGRDKQLVSQRLVTGLTLALEGSNSATTLYVVDPPADGEDGDDEGRTDGAELSMPFEVSSDVDRRDLRRALTSATILDCAAAAGAYDVLYVAARHNSYLSTLSSVITEARTPELSRFEADDARWVGEVVETKFHLNHIQPSAGLGSIRVRYGIQDRVYDAIRVPAFWDARGERGDVAGDEPAVEIRKERTLSRGELRTVLRFGDGFLADITISGGGLAADGEMPPPGRSA